MGEADSSLPCSTCRLLETESLEEEDEEAKATLLLFILPGAAMVLLGCRWVLVVGSTWRRQRREEMRDLVGLPPLPAPPGSCIPWESLTKLLLFLPTLLLTLITSAPTLPSSAILLLTSFHVSFLLSGLVDLLHSSPNLLLPEGLQSLALASAFLVQAICFNALTPSLPLLTPTLLLLALVTLLELLSASRLLKFLRCFLTLLQAQCQAIFTHSYQFSGKLVGHSWTPSPLPPSPHLGDRPLHLAPRRSPAPQPPPPLHLVLWSLSTQTSTSPASNINFTLINTVSYVRESDYQTYIHRSGQFIKVRQAE